METILMNDIDFKSLKTMPSTSKKSKIYYNDSTVYKLFLNELPSLIKNIYYKLLEASNLNINGIVTPEKFIMQETGFIGYTMDYIPNAITFSKKFNTNKINCYEYFEAVKKASEILARIHKEGIIYKDLNFHNILIDKDKMVYFCDFDSCIYHNYKSPYMSNLMKRFMEDYRQERISDSPNFDRISLMISFLYHIFNEEIQNVSYKDYKKLSKDIKTLKNMEDYVYALLNCEHIPEIPYLDDLIILPEDTVINRKRKRTI